MSATIAMFRASLLSITRDRQLVVGIIAFPLIFLIAFAAFDLGLTGTALGGAGEIDYYDFVVPGLLAMSAMDFAVSWTSSSYARLGETKVLRRLDATPIRRSSFLAGQVGARALVAAAQAAVVLGVATLLGATFEGSAVLLAGLGLLMAATFLPIGFAIGARASGVEAAGVISGMVVLPMTFLSGAFFPIAGLPDWLEPIVAALPMAPMLEAMRSVAIGGAAVGDVLTDVALALVWLPVTFAMAVLAMRRKRPGRRVPEPTPAPAG